VSSPLFMGDLEVELRAKSDKLTRELRSAAARARRATTEMEGGFSRVQSRVAAVAGSLRAVKFAAAGIGVGALLFGLARGFQRATEQAAGLLTASQRLGIGVEALQEWRFVADQAEIGTNTLDQAIQRFGRRVGEASIGTGELRDAIDRLSIDIRDQNGVLRDTDTLLVEYLDALAGIENVQLRNALAMKAFDSEGLRLIQVLGDGTTSFRDLREEARRLGVVLNRETLVTLTEARSRMQALSRVVSAQFTRSMATLAPTIEAMTLAMLDAAVAVGSFLDSVAPDRLQSLPSLRRELAETREELERLQALPEPRTSGIARAARSGQETTLEARIAELEGLIDERQSRLNRLRRESQAVLSEGQRDALVGQVTDLERSVTRATAQAIDARTALIELEFRDRLDQIEEVRKEIEENMGSLSGGEFEDLRRRLDEAETQARRLRSSALADEIRGEGGGFLGQLRTELDAIPSLGALALSSIDALGQGLVDAASSGGNAMERLKATVVTLIQQLAAAAIKAIVLRAIMGAFGGGGPSGALPGIPSPFPNVNVSQSPVPSIPSPIPRQRGGSVFPGSMYLVGERGPEFFSPGQAGAITPAGGVVVNVIEPPARPEVTERVGLGGRREIDIRFDGMLARRARAGGVATQAIEQPRPVRRS